MNANLLVPLLALIAFMLSGCEEVNASDGGSDTVTPQELFYTRDITCGTYTFRASSEFTRHPRKLRKVFELAEQTEERLNSYEECEYEFNYLEEFEISGTGERIFAITKREGGDDDPNSRLAGSMYETTLLLDLQNWQWLEFPALFSSWDRSSQIILSDACEQIQLKRIRNPQNIYECPSNIDQYDFHLEPNDDGTLGFSKIIAKTGLCGIGPCANGPESMADETILISTPLFKLIKSEFQSDFRSSGSTSANEQQSEVGEPTFIATPVTTNEPCDDYWFVRNNIFDKTGYCFNSNLGRSVFDNSNCTTISPEIAAADVDIIEKIKGMEQSWSCRVDTNRTTLALHSLDNRKILTEQPLRDLTESGCSNYNGSTIPLYSARSEKSRIIGYLRPQSDFGNAHTTFDSNPNNWIYISEISIDNRMTSDIGWTNQRSLWNHCASMAG